MMTNGAIWQFYKLIPTGQVYENPPDAIGEMNWVLGLLRHLFMMCEKNLTEL
ncbi:MAG: hypothetical protein VKJ46_09735 [Leptolyngbyaceae bacterium]|nr:hypothetical protein [Leptolyngbyaceae bacterium]